MNHEKVNELVAAIAQRTMETEKTIGAVAAVHALGDDGAILRLGQKLSVDPVAATALTELVKLLKG